MGAKKTVRIIPQMHLITETVTEPQKKKVAAYARVSTDKEEQESSFELQVDHYTQVIRNNPEWEMVKIYADPGISGTKAEKRPEFMQMIQDCRDGKIDIILVKSFSRFSRNTVDFLTYVRELRDLGVSVRFETENIDTASANGDILMTILAAIAEQESRSISENIKWAYQKKFERGSVVLNTSQLLGYRKAGTDEEGNAIYEIVEEEAQIIRRIYGDYVAGKTIHQIAKGLEADGILTKTGKTKWYTRTILNILQNEKYTGNALMGKTYKPDVMSKKRMKNNGEAPMYYLEGSHPAIIEKSVFDLVQSEIVRRSSNPDMAAGVKKYASKYTFSGLLICGHCHHKMRRQMRDRAKGRKEPYWACSTKVLEGKKSCQLNQLKESTVEQVFLAAIQDLVGDADDFVDKIGINAELAMEDGTVKRLEAVAARILEIQESIFKLQKDHQRNKITTKEYSEKLDEMIREIDTLEAEKKELQTASNRYEDVKNQLEAFRKILKADRLEENSLLVKSLVEQILVYDDYMEIYFKCGIVARAEFE